MFGFVFSLFLIKKEMKVSVGKCELINDVVNSDPEEMKAHFTKFYLPDLAARINLQND